MDILERAERTAQTMICSDADKRTIPVVMAFDVHYHFPTCVTVCSVLKHAGPDDRYRFYFLTSPETAVADPGVFDALSRQYPHFSWEYIPVDTTLFSGVRLAVEHISVPTYFRLLIPELLPRHDWCIYLDSDMIVLDDLARLRDECLTAVGPSFAECYLAAVQDIPIQVEELGWSITHLHSIGRKNGLGYFNGGMLVLNLDKLRRDRMVSVFLSQVNKNYYYGDQDILNLTCAGQILYLPARYNLGVYYMGNRFVADRGCRNEEDWWDTMRGRPVICHFLGPDKPWNRIETVWANLWYEMASCLPRTAYVREQLEECAAHRVDHSRRDLFENAKQAEDLILYGFTPSARLLCDDLLAMGFANIRFFCDKDPAKTGLFHSGIVCRGRDALAGLPEEAMIVICAQKPWAQIKQELEGMGVKSSRLARYRLLDHRIIDMD